MLLLILLTPPVAVVLGYCLMSKIMAKVKEKCYDKKQYYYVAQALVGIGTLIVISIGTLYTIVFAEPFISGCFDGGCTAEMISTREAVYGSFVPILIIVNAAGVIMFFVNLARLSKYNEGFGSAQDFIKYADITSDEPHVSVGSEKVEPIDISGGIFSPDENKEK